MEKKLKTAESVDATAQAQTEVLEKAEKQEKKQKRDKLAAMPSSEKDKYTKMGLINANGDIIIDVRLLGLYFTMIEADKNGILLPSSVKAFIEDEYLIEKYGERFSGITLPKWFVELYKERVEKGHKNISSNVRIHEVLKAVAFGYALTVKPTIVDGLKHHPLLELKNKASLKGAMHVAEIVLELYKEDEDGTMKKSLITFKTSSVFNMNNSEGKNVGLPCLPYKNVIVDGKHRQQTVVPEDCTFDTHKLFKVSKTYREVCEGLQRLFMYGNTKNIDVTSLFDYSDQPLLNIKAIQGKVQTTTTTSTISTEVAASGIKIPRKK